MGAAGQDVDFVFEAMDAFLKGRHLISTEAGNAELLRAQAVRALGAWEQTIAATTIHYINKTVKELGEWGTDAYLFKDHVKFWGEMKGFALAFQFSPVAILSDAGFDRFHELVGDVPVLGTATEEEKTAYTAKLLEARDILQSAYGFSDETVAAW